MCVCGGARTFFFFFSIAIVVVAWFGLVSTNVKEKRQILSPCELQEKIEMRYSVLVIEPSNLLESN